MTYNIREPFNYGTHTNYSRGSEKACTLVKVSDSLDFILSPLDLGKQPHGLLALEPFVLAEILPI
jgi:hypothetical protein